MNHFVETSDLGEGVRFGLDDSLEPSSCDATHEERVLPGLMSGGFLDLGDTAERMEVRMSRVLDARITLKEKRHEPVRPLAGRLEGSDRLGTADSKRQKRSGRDQRVARWNHG